MANAIVNPGFETAPPGSVATTTNTAVYLDNTANGSSNYANSYGWNKGGSQGSIAVLFDGANPHTGNYSLKCSLTAVNSYVEVFTPVPGGGFGGYRGKFIPVRPNTNYIFSFWMKTNYISGAATTGATIAVLESDVNGLATGTDYVSPYINTTTGWTQYILPFTTGASCVYVQINPRVYGHQGAATLIMDTWYDDLFLEDQNGNFVMYNNMGMGR